MEFKAADLWVCAGPVWIAVAEPPDWSDWDPEHVRAVVEALGREPSYFVQVDVSGRLPGFLEVGSLCISLLGLRGGIAVGDYSVRGWTLPDILNSSLHGRAFFSADAPLAAYIAAAGAAEHLSAEDEIRMARLIDKGRRAAGRMERRPPFMHYRIEKLKKSGQQAKSATKQFVDSSRRLVIPIAEEYTGRGMDLMDLIEEGNHGLRRAIEQFDWRKPYDFSTHADSFIHKAIERGLQDQGPGEGGSAGVREPRNPYPPIDSAAAAADLDHEATGPIAT